MVGSLEEGGGSSTKGAVQSTLRSEEGAAGSCSKEIIDFLTTGSSAIRKSLISSLERTRTFVFSNLSNLFAY